MAAERRPTAEDLAVVEALREAIIQNDEGGVRQLLEAKATPYQMGLPNIYGYPALHEAARFNRPKIITRLAEAGAADLINQHDFHNGYAPLHYAVAYTANQGTETIKALLDAKADINNPNTTRKWTPLHHVCGEFSAGRKEEAHYYTAQLLLERRADPWAFSQSSPKTPLEVYLQNRPLENRHAPNKLINLLQDAMAKNFSALMNKHLRSAIFAGLHPRTGAGSPLRAASASTLFDRQVMRIPLKLALAMVTPEAVEITAANFDLRKKEYKDPNLFFAIRRGVSQAMHHNPLDFDAAPATSGPAPKVHK